jgi:predicted methyltransferase
MRHFIAIIAAAGLAACGQSGEEAPDTEAPDAPETETAAADPVAPEEMEAVIERALEDSSRPEQDRLRDENRHPAEILTFAGVEPGWAVADIAAGGGYYSRILSTAVGEEGHVFSFNPDWIRDRFTETDQNLAALAEQRANMTHLNGQTAAFNAEIDQTLDAVFSVLVYHDTAWAPDFKPEEDREAMNQAVFDSLRPGGVYLVIDHHAVEGTGLESVGTFHRIDAAVVRAEVEAAGFVLEQESDLLANAEDPRDISVFDGSIRGRTDRFVYLFRKPE